MSGFETMYLPVAPNAHAPDGSDVRNLLVLDAGGMAHFELPPGRIAVPEVHRTVDEIWYFLTGRGEMWRKLGDQEETVPVYPGVCITIPVGTHFQWRSFGHQPLAALGVTIPPWPGPGEGHQVPGPWEPTVESGPG